MTKTTRRIQLKAGVYQGSATTEWECSTPAYRRFLRVTMKRIRDEAARLGRSQAELSRISGLHENTVARFLRYETVWPRFATVYLMATALGFEIRIEKRR